MSGVQMLTECSSENRLNHSSCQFDICSDVVGVDSFANAPVDLSVYEGWLSEQVWELCNACTPRNPDTSTIPLFQQSLMEISCKPSERRTLTGEMLAKRAAQLNAYFGDDAPQYADDANRARHFVIARLVYAAALVEGSLVSVNGDNARQHALNLTLNEIADATTLAQNEALHRVLYPHLFSISHRLFTTWVESGDLHSSTNPLLNATIRASFTRLI